MAGVGIASYWASVGVKTEEKGLKDVDSYLKKIENKLKQGVGKNGLSITPKINVEAFEKHLRNVLRNVGGTGNNALRVRVQVSDQHLRKSIENVTVNKPVTARVVAKLDRSSIQIIREQLRVALADLTIGARLGSVLPPRRRPKGLDGSDQDAFNPNPWGGSKGGPSILERIRGRPERGSLSAANRRYFDATGKSIFASGNSITGWIGETLGGGLVSQGASTMVGRAGITLASSIGGMRAGGFVGAGLGVLTAGAQAGAMAWKGLLNVITTPFQLVGSAASAVTGAFYKLAMVVAPLVLAFGYVNQRVQGITSKNIATDTSAARFGTTGQRERDWLYNMSMSEGMRYEELLMPYSSFLNAYAPKQGVQASREMFQAFSQYGRVNGATKESSSRAFYALSQIASKGNVTSEELNQQLAEAQGYSGAKQLFAEAYLMSQGKTKEQAKADKDAIQKLADEMKKGNVKSDKIFPFLAQLMMEAAAPGIATARLSSGAEEDRFWNKMYKGWENFTTGGGEKGLQFFWQMMQNLGDWFSSNGAELGNYFRILMVDLNTLRVGLKELFQFAWTGKSNDLVEIAKENGFDLPKIRDSLLQLFDSIGVLVKQVLKSLGFDTGNGLVAGLGAKILRFTEDLNKVFVSLTEMFKYLGTVFSEFGRISEMGYTELAFAASPVGVGLGAAGAYNNPFVNIAGAVSKAGAAFGQATVGAGTATVNALTQPGMTPQGVYNPIANPQLNLLPPSNPLQMYTPLMQNQMGAPQKLEGNVNITLTVEGNSDLAAQLNTPQVQSIIRKTTQEGISNMLLQAVPTAPIK